MLDQLNDAAEKIGGKWMKLNRREHGVIEGELIDCEIRPKTFEGSPVLSRKTGEQRTDWVLTLKVDPTDDEDDGLRKLSLNEAGQRALAAAIKESKAKVQPGSRVKIAVTEDPPGDRDQATYKAQHTPPALPVNDAVFATAGADPDPF